jgi:hypothetical protein
MSNTFQFSKGIAHLVEKKTKKNKDCPLSKFECFESGKKQIVPSFKDVNFVINGKYFKNIYDNPNYNVSL